MMTRLHTTIKLMLLALAFTYGTMAVQPDSFAMATGPSNPPPETAQPQTETESTPQIDQTATVKKDVVIPQNVQQAAEGIVSNILTANAVPANKVASITITGEDVINAATDGKKIIFTLALWNALKTDDQRAFVISHEISHITLNHIPKTMARRVGLMAVNHYVMKAVGKGDGAKSKAAKTASQIGIMLTDTKFSRSAEYGADERGIQYMAKAGYNTQGAVETLEVLQALDTSGTPQFMRSHPISKNRIEALSKQYQN